MGMWRDWVQVHKDLFHRYQDREHAAHVGQALGKDAYDLGLLGEVEDMAIFDAAHVKGVNMQDRTLMQDVLRGFTEGAKQAQYDALPWYRKLKVW